MQTLFHGHNARHNMFFILEKHNFKRIFLVVDKDSYAVSGAQSTLHAYMQDKEVVCFSEFEKNPKIEDIAQGIKFFNAFEPDCVIAIGGGSVIDMAKSITLLSQQNRDLGECIEQNSNLKNRTVPLLVIPTTAGSGSEATHFSVVYKNSIKYSLTHKSLVPDYAILDPFFIKSLPAYVAAYTGMDALCQGIESFWSVNSTEESRQYSVKAIVLALETIEKNVHASTEKTRENMLLASYWAGKAINIAKTTIAHSVSYPLTSYFGIPHGHAVALTLPYFVVLNSQISEQTTIDNRGIVFVKDRMKELWELCGVGSAREFFDLFIVLMNKLQLKRKLSDFDITKEDIETIVKNGFNPQRAKNNPRLITEQDLRSLLEQAL